MWRLNKSSCRMLTVFLFDGHIRNIVNLDFDIYTTFTVSAALELPADLLSIISVDQLGRKWSAAGSLFLSGVCMIICGLVRGE